MPTPHDAAILNRLARALPDVPRWIETRSMLLLGECELFGLEDGDEQSFVVRDTGSFVSVVGRPSVRAIQEAAGGPKVEVIVPPENAPHVSRALAGWEATPATLHMLGPEPRFPPVAPGDARLLEPLELDLIEGLPPDLRSELAAAASKSLIAAAFAGERPVAFCYAVRTESLWDISIDTLEGYRRQGHAARCVAFMVEHLRPLRPVWGAEDTNGASLALAARLGFVPVDKLIIFRPALRRPK